ncbi:MAG: O-acetyl-ADP-ribose deacetylase [Lentisphaerae bacterium ADurb.Bin242]|nr:MAG: O-acetyl-ADP-ribose deacetylase [Lentisphaerae bacterium ADurb.Bin242]
MIIRAILEDITALAVDAIVNAANCSLLGGGGVDGAIHRAAGPELLKACRPLGGCKTGEARITPGFRLSAKYVIHTPGPVWHGGNHREPELLRNCYRNSLELANGRQCRTVAFPGISTGVYSYPLRAASEIAVKTVSEWDGRFPEETIFCCFSREALEIYQEILKYHQTRSLS